MSLLTALGIAVVGAIAGAYLTKLWTPNPVAEIVALRRELAALQEQVATSERERIAQKQDDELWTAKFESAATQVVKVGPSLMVRSPKGDSDMPLYNLIFPDINTRMRIQSFLVHPDWRLMSFSMQLPSAVRLRSLTVRKVVDEALEYIDVFRKKYPELATKYLNPGL
jgi:hypothetical protein